MLNKTIAIFTSLVISANVANADMLGDFPNIQNDVNSFMNSEIIDISNGFPGTPPWIDCGCPHLCAMWGRIASGEISGEDKIQAALLSATVTDQAGAIKMGIKSGGKFDSKAIPHTRVKMKYSKDFDGKALAKLSQQIGKLVLN